MSPSHSHPLRKTKTPWPFPVHPNTAVVVSKTIKNGQEPVRLVKHDDEFNWSFLDLRTIASEKNLTVICFECLTEIDGTLFDTAKLPADHVALRNSIDGRWKTKSVFRYHLGLLPWPQRFFWQITYYLVLPVAIFAAITGFLAFVILLIKWLSM